MSITLKGYNISLVRPSKHKTALVYQSEQSYARHQSRTKTIQEHCGRVVEVVVEAEGYIYSLAKGTHLDVLEAFGLEAEAVTNTGWLLTNGSYVWRN